jgi:hypothetical protein
MQVEHFVWEFWNTKRNTQLLGPAGVFESRFRSSRSKDCHSLPVIPNNTYQIRATFCHGVYDNQYLTSPSFHLAIDGTIVNSIFIGDPFDFQYKEYWVLSQTNVISLCLSRDSSKTNSFISAISLVREVWAHSFLYLISIFLDYTIARNFVGISVVVDSSGI